MGPEAIDCGMDVQGNSQTKAAYVALVWGRMVEKKTAEAKEVKKTAIAAAIKLVKDCGLRKLRSEVIFEILSDRIPLFDKFRISVPSQKIPTTAIGDIGYTDGANTGE